MPEPTPQKTHWLIHLGAILISAVASGFGSAFMGTLVLVFLWQSEAASMGVIGGAPIGFLIGLGLSIRQVKRQAILWKAIIYPILQSSLIATLIALVVGLTPLIFSALD